MGGDNLFNKTGRKVTKGKLDSPQWAKFVDKQEFKEVCKKHNIPTFETLFIFDDLNQLKAGFHELPNSFMAKSTKGSGRNVAVKNKSSWTAEGLAKKLKDFDKNYDSFEKQYNHKRARIIIEKMYDPIPEDIKVVVSKYEPTLVWVDQDRFADHKRLPYKVQNGELKKLDCFWAYKNSKNKSIVDDLTKKEISFILEKSKALAKEVGLDLVRIDFYKVEGGIYGGEVTLTSGAYSENIDDKCADIAINGSEQEKMEGVSSPTPAPGKNTVFTILIALVLLLVVVGAFFTYRRTKNQAKIFTLEEPKNTKKGKKSK
jgi:hypothetical protein